MTKREMEERIAELERRVGELEKQVSELQALFGPAQLSSGPLPEDHMPFLAFDGENWTWEHGGKQGCDWDWFGGIPRKL